MRGEPEHLEGIGVDDEQNRDPLHGLQGLFQIREAGGACRVDAADDKVDTGQVLRNVGGEADVEVRVKLCDRLLVAGVPLHILLYV